MMMEEVVGSALSYHGRAWCRTSVLIRASSGCLRRWRCRAPATT